jgi:molecular chaperone DnaJ
MEKDYYKLLGLSRNATEDEVKTAYRKLAHKYHPDKAGGDEAMFKKINEAYQTLSNKEKRAQYDRFGKTFDGMGGGGQGGFDFRNFGGNGFEFGFDPSGFEDMGNLGDMFDAFFEGMGVKRKRRTYERGADLEFIQEIMLEEAYRGARKPITFKTHIVCEKCAGLGHFPKEGFTDCGACDGRGEIQESRRTFFGNFQQVRECKKCAGQGKIPNKICGTCSSSGRITSEKTLELTIAPGIADGQVIKVTKAGEMGERGAEAGDLYVRIRVKPHPVFTREGDDLLMREEMRLVDLLIHRSVEVKTISGEKISIAIPQTFTFGEEITVQGAGMPHLGSHGRGNLRIDLRVQIPKKLSKKAEDILKELKGEL